MKGSMVGDANYTISDTCEFSAVLSPWQAKIMSGNQAYKAQTFLRARDEYQSALVLATRILDEFLLYQKDNIVIGAIEHSLPAVVVSAHNLADTFIALEQPNRACAQLTSVHFKVHEVFSQLESEVAAIALHHLHKTRQELIHFAKRYPHLPELIHHINEAMLNTHIRGRALH
ncbi:hypothetical protein EAG18_14290 [Pseudoalteromonas sp. J010]|uniref:hypothetical protein n=1 Tax=Pseudoalteromonas sp. J010 TaxID=998465 RepID=UPI000F64B165|nr:hypothetical protein [Pseudoalteromonas sp. J010]RRS07964.1 hypothetical protein EAG18_14290 [Pseudoalteromonas sp. J010]